MAKFRLKKLSAGFDSNGQAWTGAQLDNMRSEVRDLIVNGIDLSVIHPDWNTLGYSAKCEVFGIPTQRNELDADYVPTEVQIAAWATLTATDITMMEKELKLTEAAAQAEFEALLDEPEKVNGHGFLLGAKVAHLGADGNMSFGTVVFVTGGVPSDKVPVEIDGKVELCRPKSLVSVDLDNVQPDVPDEPIVPVVKAPVYIKPQNSGQKYAAFLIHPESKRASRDGLIDLLTTPAMDYDDAVAAVDCWRAKGVQKP
jgi:hypothetical protein